MSDFAYELTGFTNVLGRLVVGVRGDWAFLPDGAGTVVDWTYEFRPRPGRHAVLRFGVAPLWRRYLADCLTRAVAAVER